MNKDALHKILPQVEAIARAAGAEIMRHYDGTNTYTKNDGSCVTDADHAAEAIILPALQKLTPNIPIVSEENFEGGARPDISGGTFWTVDPLDGTAEFINKTDAFVVAIALVVDHKPVLGVIYHPAKDLLYGAVNPGFAHKKEGDQDYALLTAKPAPERILVNGGHADIKRIEGYLSAQFRDAAKIDTKSGILRACQVADSLAGLAIICSGKRNGRTYFWDVAPGHAIIEAAGGKVEDFDGKPVRYDADDYQVPPHASFAPASAKKAPPSERRP